MDEDAGESKRLSYLVSGLVHLSVILVLLSFRFTTPVAPAPSPSPRVVQRVRLVPPAGYAPPRPPTPAPPASAKSAISVGAESERRQKELLLERDVEITNERIGPGLPGPQATRPGVASPGPSTPAPAPSGGPVTHDGGEVLPAPRTAAGRLDWPSPSEGGLRGSLRDLERRIGTGDAGVTRRGGQKMGPLNFDPRGADFTAWINHWRREVYRNWVIPQPALLGLRGHVDLEFTVRRDGTVTDLRILKGSGVPAFDKAAANAILASGLLRLPADYVPDTVTMQATFFYNEDPQHS